MSTTYERYEVEVWSSLTGEWLNSSLGGSPTPEEAQTKASEIWHRRHRIVGVDANGVRTVIE